MDNLDEIEVQVSNVGTYYGSDKDGNPVRENLTQEALNTLAEKLNGSGEEVLVDVDHKSLAAGPQKDTAAAGWLSRFYATVKGLFARMRLTPKGAKLVHDGVYRHLSPVFKLGENSEPVELDSVGMTNTPALRMRPILNSQPNEDITDMTKEEVKDLIKATLEEMKQAETALNATPAEEKKEPEKAEEQPKEACNEEPKKEEPKAEEPKQEEKPEEPKAEEKAEEKAEQPKEEVKPEKEVIKEETLNSAPVEAPSIDEPWKDLHGKAFFDYLAKNNIR